MVVISKDEARREFAKNLNAALEDKGAPKRGRPEWLRLKIGKVVSRESCRKWLAGEDIPDQANLSVLIAALGLNAQQLRTGQWEPPPGASDERLALLTKSWPELADETRQLIMNAIALDRNLGRQADPQSPSNPQPRRRRA